jgi:glycosyltransferase involved in cell wall biosynthesis
MQPPNAQREGVYTRRWTRFEGLFFDEFAPDSAWIREEGVVYFPVLPGIKRIVVQGYFRPTDNLDRFEAVTPELDIKINSAHIATITLTQNEPWEVGFDVPTEQSETAAVIGFKLRKVGFTNLLAWLGRIGEHWPIGPRLQRYRAQRKNRQMRVTRILVDGEVVYDFSNRHAPYSPEFARKHAHFGLNVVGFLTADLGIGESARCMVRAADAAEIPAAAIPLKLPCKAHLGDSTFAAFVQERNPHAVNVFHLDPPASHDIDVHHGPEFRQNKYNIGYWAWELPEFPDAWLGYFNYFDEIWCPSHFVRDAITPKSPLPVFTMPHAVAFDRPLASTTELRTKFGLPQDRFLFLFLYDLNSYSERKNPRAVIEAFRASGLAAKGASLVIKVHGVAGNENDLVALRSAVGDWPDTVLVTKSFTRTEIYELESACDCFVSLHRSEGFGFALAESMYLGKPVIATDWSATTEFLSKENGCPVRYTLVALERNHGPYGKGQIWAEPDTHHAAEWMQRLVADPELAVRLGAAGRATIEKNFSPSTIGARYRRRLEAIASW